MQLGHYLTLLHRSQRTLAEGFRAVAAAHADETDVQAMGEKLARQCDQHAERLAPFERRYRADASNEPEALHSDLFKGPRSGGLGLLRDLHDLYLLASECDIVWTLVGQAAQGARDPDLLGVVQACEGETSAQIAWLHGRMKEAAPQALVVAS